MKRIRVTCTVELDVPENTNIVTRGVDEMVGIQIGNKFYKPEVTWMVACKPRGGALSSYEGIEDPIEPDGTTLLTELPTDITFTRNND
jgi:hypothetical protein